MEGFLRYFDRSYYRTVEKKFEIRPIIYCWWFNFTVSFIVAVSIWFMTFDVISMLLYTMSAWTVTLTTSIVYWLYWVQKKMKEDQKGVKLVASSAILIMFLIALVFIMRTFVILREATIIVS